jgi:hypothetical protein
MITAQMKTRQQRRDAQRKRGVKEGVNQQKGGGRSLDMVSYHVKGNGQTARAAG